jgi:hypothetical protein
VFTVPVVPVYLVYCTSLCDLEPDSCGFRTKRQFKKMSTSEIFKYLLDILKLESNLMSHGNKSADYEYVAYASALVRSIEVLEKAIVQDSVLDCDRVKILPNMLKCFSRLLSKTVSLATYSVKQEALLIATMDCLSSIIEKLMKVRLNVSSSLSRKQRKNERNKPDIDPLRIAVQKVFRDELTSVTTIYLHVLAVFESINQQQHHHGKQQCVRPASSADAQGSSRSVNNEPLLWSTLQLYSALVSCRRNLDMQAALNQLDMPIDFSRGCGFGISISTCNCNCTRAGDESATYEATRDSTSTNTTSGTEMGLRTEISTGTGLSTYERDPLFEGALASQTLLALLHSCKHRAKHIAVAALTALLLTMQAHVLHLSDTRCIHNRNVSSSPLLLRTQQQQIDLWKSGFPGIFSTLFVVSQSKHAR